MNINTVMLMRVASVVDKDVDHPQFFDPSYPLKYLQAGLNKKEGLKVYLEDCWVDPLSESDMIKLVDSVKPDLLVISASSFDVFVADSLVNSLRDRGNSFLIFGIGQGYYEESAENNKARDLYDAVLLGEPEEEFFRLFERITETADENDDWREEYKKSYKEGKRYLVRNPDELAFPVYTPDELKVYRSIFPVPVAKRVTWGYTIGMRGCPYECVFCSEVMRVSVGKKLRRRSAANVADEMEHMVKQGVNIVSFQDDSFTSGRSFVKSICEELISRNSKIPWMARVRVDEVNFELLKLMKQAGCVILGIGVESGTQRIIDDQKKTYKPKPWAELCRKVFKWTRELGIGTNAYYVIGNPTETREEIENTIRLALELNADTIQVHYYTPYPGSEAWVRYKDILKNDEVPEMFHYARPQISLAEVSIDELEKLRAKFYRRYIFRPAFLIRHFWRYTGFYLRNPDIFFILAGIHKLFWRSEAKIKQSDQKSVSKQEVA